MPHSNKEVVKAITYAKPLQLPISSATDGQVSSQMQPPLSLQAALHAAARATIRKPLKI